MAQKWDAKRDLDDYRGRRGEFRFVELPPRRYLAVDGHGPGRLGVVRAGGGEPLPPPTG